MAWWIVCETQGMGLGRGERGMASGQGGCGLGTLDETDGAQSLSIVLSEQD